MAPILKRPPKKKRKHDDSGGSTLPNKLVNSSAPVSSRVQVCNVDLRVQQCKKFAVAQVKQEACLGSYKSFDSPFGNYLLPVIPNVGLFLDKEVSNQYQN